MVGIYRIVPPLGVVYVRDDEAPRVGYKIGAPSVQEK
jgi:hypothetical protein